MELIESCHSLTCPVDALRQRWLVKDILCGPGCDSHILSKVNPVMDKTATPVSGDEQLLFKGLFRNQQFNG